MIVFEIRKRLVADQEKRGATVLERIEEDQTTLELHPFQTVWLANK